MFTNFQFFREISISRNLFIQIYIYICSNSSEDVSEDDESGGLDSDESEGKDWSDLEREAAEDDDDDDDDRDRGMLFT